MSDATRNHDPDRWATLVTKGEAGGCYPCDTCSGFRAKGQPCAFCRGALGNREEQIAEARSEGRREALLEALKEIEDEGNFWDGTRDKGCARGCRAAADRVRRIEAVRSLSSRGETKGDKP